MTEHVVERLFPRAGKASGPWDTEPDRIAWTDPETGYPVLIKRNQFGSWCGYVAVPPGHSAHGRDCNELDDIEVHAGLTYSAACMGAPETGICHVPTEGEPDDVWWLGFDCAHAGDYNWSMAGLREEHPVLAEEWQGVYRTVDYVRKECTRLARQLGDIGNP